MNWGNHEDTKALRGGRNAYLGVGGRREFVRELSLFTGAGGGVLGTKLLGFKHIGYVEYEPYCQKILAQRINDGILDAAPIFGDIRKFIDEGYAESYSGLVDIVTAGFPCQPFSVAGKGKGKDDSRNMWPATIGVLRIVRPRFALLENVPGLLAHGYMGRIFGDLAEAGYDARWCVLGADDCGAPHRRKRLWILAHTSKSGAGDIGGEVGGGPKSEVLRQGNGAAGTDRTESTGGNEADVAHSARPGLEGAEWKEHEGIGKRPTKCGWWDQDPADLPDTERKGLEGAEAQPIQRGECEQNNGNQIRSGHKPSGRGEERPTQPRLGRVVDGLADFLDLIEAAFGGKIPRVAHNVAKRVDRLKAIGNGQVPICVATAWRVLNGNR